MVCVPSYMVPGTCYLTNLLAPTTVFVPVTSNKRGPPLLTLVGRGMKYDTLYTRVPKMPVPLLVLNWCHPYMQGSGSLFRVPGTGM